MLAAAAASEEGTTVDGGTGRLPPPSLICLLLQKSFSSSSSSSFAAVPFPLPVCLLAAVESPTHFRTRRRYWLSYTVVSLLQLLRFRHNGSLISYAFFATTVRCVILRSLNFDKLDVVVAVVGLH